MQVWKQVRGNYLVIRYSFALLLVISMFSCDLFKVKKDGKIIARVYDKMLSIEEVAEVIPKNVDSKDSLDILNRYVKSWVTKQLLLRNAESNFEFNEIEVERKLLDYRYALIVYEYEKQYLSKHLDTAISDQEVEAYYIKNIDNFELKQNIVKGMYVKLPHNSPKIQKLRTYMKSSKKDYKSIRSYCYRFATNYVLNDTVWNNFEEMIAATPFINVPDKVQFLKKTQFAEIDDSTHSYFLSINAYKIIDQNSPLEFVKGHIENIILNKRKVDLVQKLERNIYNNALKKKDFEIFIENN